jgi:hypothetical protein
VFVSFEELSDTLHGMVEPLDVLLNSLDRLPEEIPPPLADKFPAEEFPPPLTDKFPAEEFPPPLTDKFPGEEFPPPLIDKFPAEEIPTPEEFPRVAKIPIYSGRFLWKGGEIPFRRFLWPRFLKEIPW